MENKLIVSLSPHVHGGDSVQKNMYGVLIALIPAFLVSLYFFGLGALIVTATSVAACLFFEWAIGKYLMKKPTTTICDGSAIITGVLLAFNLPSNLPIWIIILGALFAIGVGKMSFGGLGCNPFNPALAGRVFLLLSFPVQMTSWPVVGQLTAYTDATTGALEEDHHLAYSCVYPGYRVYLCRYHALGRSGKICFSDIAVALRWSDAGCCLYGNRLCDFSDE